MMRGKQRGAVNLIVVVLMLLVVGAGLALAASMVTTSVGDAVLEDDSTVALYIAESGLEAAVGNFNASRTCTNTGVGVVAGVSFGRGTYSIQSATVVGTLCQIVVSGAIGSVVRTIQADVALGSAIGLSSITQRRGNGNLSVAHATAGSDRLLVVLLALRTNTAPVSGVTYAGVPLTLADARLRTAGGANVRSEVWFLPNPAAGTNTLDVQNSGGRIVLHAASLTGVDQASPLAASATTCNDGNSNAARLDITTIRSGSWLVDSLATEPGGGLTPAAGQVGTSLQSGGAPAVRVAGGASYRIVPTAGASFMEWTFSSRGWAHCGVAVQPAQGGIVNWAEL